MSYIERLSSTNEPIPNNHNLAKQGLYLNNSTNAPIKSNPASNVLPEPKKKKKKKSFKNIMSEMTSKTTTIEQDKINNKNKLKMEMKHANFDKLERI